MTGLSVVHYCADCGCPTPVRYSTRVGTVSYCATCARLLAGWDDRAPGHERLRARLAAPGFLEAKAAARKRLDEEDAR